MHINFETLRNYQLKEECILLTSKGYSMAPFIQEPVQIYVKCCVPENIKKGDIVVFYDEKAVVCHRCIDVNGDLFLERGDNCCLFCFPEWRSKNAVIGIVIGIVKKNRMILVDKFKWYREVVLMIAKYSYKFAYKNSVDKEMKGSVLGKLLFLVSYIILQLESRKK